ncbi:MAG: MATE family efflux transporter, partial [Acholeplasmataceae bacterium]
MTKDERKKYLILEHPNIYKGLMILALPVMLNNFIKTIQDIIDMFFVSSIPNYSTEAISAISLTFPVNFTYISLGIGLSAAGTALISQFIGANNHKSAKKYAGNLLVISLLLGVALTLFSFFVSPLIMELMGTKNYVLEQSSLYLRIRSFELPFVFLFFAFTAIRQSSGDTTTPVYFGIATIILNIILTPIFVSYFELGVSGAAYATLISNVIIAPPIIYVLFFSKNGIKIHFSDFKVETEIVSEILSKAVPASLGQAFTAIG